VALLLSLRTNARRAEQLFFAFVSTRLVNRNVFYSLVATTACMSDDYKTLRVPADAKAAADDSKRDTETWGEFLRRLSDNPPEQREHVPVDTVADAISEQVADTVARRVVAELRGR
jgi:hypothetical protein